MIHYNKTLSRLMEFLLDNPQCRFVITKGALHFCNAHDAIHCDFYNGTISGDKNSPISYDSDRDWGIHGYIQSATVSRNGKIKFRVSSDDAKQAKTCPMIAKMIDRGFARTVHRLSFEW